MSYDVIHQKPRTSIYERTDYIVNSDMTIPFAFAANWRHRAAIEMSARTGLPPNNRQAGLSPLVLKAPRMNPPAK